NSGLTAALNCTSPTPSSLFSELEKNLFSNSLVPPVKSFSYPVNITISITVVGILGVVSVHSPQLYAHILFLKSKSLTLYAGQYSLNAHFNTCSAKIQHSFEFKINYQYQILFYSSIGEDGSPRIPYVYLNNTGHVYDDKPVKVVSSCQLGIYTFPFDIQNCSLTFGSYLHFATDIMMIQGSTSEEILQESREVLQTNGEWELADIGKTKANAFEFRKKSRYKDINLEALYLCVFPQLILRRRPVLYVVNLLIPSCFLITVDLFSFLLPPQSVDRSSFKTTLILGYTVFLLIMNDLLPATGEKTPLISVFFSLSLALMVTSLLETVFITNIQFSSSQNSAVPHWLSVLVLRYLAVVVCIPPKKKSSRVTSISNDPIKPPSSPPHPLDPTLDELRRLSRDLAAIRHQMDSYFQGTKASQEWQMIGTVVDRLLFALYIVFIVVSFITIISIWIWNNSYAA
uniref:Uncharacterized protein n=1 Tax=Amphiprion percula TaxID=161767 RepID=A0A3P8RV02_AMPPE